MPLNYNWRVTRYDPARRDAQGCYPLGDWSCFSDVGQVFSGSQFTYQEYLTCESAYVDAADAFAAAAGLDGLQVASLENKGIANANAGSYKDIALTPTSLKVGSVVSGNAFADVVRLNLREVVWCKLAVPSRFYLHFGWDFYMYIGSETPSAAAIHHAEESGLFVEAMKSPYL